MPKYDANKPPFTCFRSEKNYYFDPISNGKFTQITIKVLFIEITIAFKKGS